MSRPRVDIDLEEFEKLAALACTQADIAGWFGVTVNTIEKRLAEDLLLETKYGQITLRQLLEIGQAKGRVSVRRQQMKLLEEGNATMAVWLGKQFLGQRDKTEITGADGTALIPLGVVDAITTKARTNRDEHPLDGD